MFSPLDHTGIVHQTGYKRLSIAQRYTHMSTSKPSVFPRIASKSSRFCISASITTTLPFPNASASFFTSASFSARRATRTRFVPALAKSLAVAAPIPTEAPVMRTGIRSSQTGLMTSYVLKKLHTGLSFESMSSARISLSTERSDSPGSVKDRHVA